MESDRERWLTPGVKRIGAASLLSDLGHEVPSSLLPRFLTSTLGAPAAALGLIEGVADGLAGIARLLGGALADDPEKRRATAVAGYATTAIFSSFIGWAGNVFTVGFLRTASWTARGLRAPSRNALLADAVPAGAYGRAYGFERAMDNLGALGGPVLALALITVFSVRDAILISIVPGLLAAVAMFSAVRHVPKLAVREHVKLRIKIAPVVRSRAGTFLTGIAAFEVGNVAATLLILRASESLSPGRSADRATQIALVLYLAYNLAATLVSIQAGRTIDRSSGIRVLVAGVAMFAVSYVLFATATANVAVLAAAFVLAGLGIGCVETAEHATIAASAPEELRGSAFGLVAAVQSFGNLAASATAGAIWTAVSPRAAFLYLAFWMVVAAGLLIWASQRKESQE